MSAGSLGETPVLPAAGGRRPFPAWRVVRPSGPVLGLLAVLALFVLLLAWRGQLGHFASLRNLQVLSHKSSVPAAVALGMLLVMITGGIDLSVGSIVALVTVVTMQLYRLVYNGP